MVALESGKGEIWTYDQIKVRRTAQGYGAGAFFATLFGFSDDASWSQRDPVTAAARLELKLAEASERVLLPFILQL